jgi:hypothetical protein
MIFYIKRKRGLGMKYIFSIFLLLPLSLAAVCTKADRQHVDTNVVHCPYNQEDIYRCYSKKLNCYGCVERRKECFYCGCLITEHSKEEPVMQTQKSGVKRKRRGY